MAVYSLDPSGTRRMSAAIFPSGITRAPRNTPPAVRDALTDLCRRIVADPDFVRVMSMHKSKGLTSPVVYAAGVTEGIMPVREAATDPAVLDEQRRLFYVAITRASERLVISGSVRMSVALAAQLQAVAGSNIRRQADGKSTVNVIASRFIADLGPQAPRPVTGTTWLAGL